MVNFLLILDVTLLFFTPILAEIGKIYWNLRHILVTYLLEKREVALSGSPFQLVLPPSLFKLTVWEIFII